MRWGTKYNVWRTRSDDSTSYSTHWHHFVLKQLNCIDNFCARVPGTGIRRFGLYKTDKGPYKKPGWFLSLVVIAEFQCFPPFNRSLSNCTNVHKVSMIKVGLSAWLLYLRPPCAAPLGPSVWFCMDVAWMPHDASCWYLFYAFPASLFSSVVCQPWPWALRICQSLKA